MSNEPTAPSTVTTFRNRTVYHSDLRKSGTITAMLLSDPEDSQFDSGLPWMRFAVLNDPEEYVLQIENPTLREHLTAQPKDRWLHITATGSHDDATITVDVPPSVTAETATAGSASSTLPPARQSPQSEPNTPARGSLSREYWNALTVAVEIVETFRKSYGREPTESERTIATGLWIETNRSRGLRPLKQAA